MKNLLKNLSKKEIGFLILIYLFSLSIRVLPKLVFDAHLPAFQADVWYRICMAQYILDNWKMPEPDIRYLAYGYVPMWYPPLSVWSMALMAKILSLDLPTLCTRIIPFFEAFSPLSIYFLARYIYNEKIAVFSTIILAITPSFIYWTGIADPQSVVVFLIPLYLLVWLKYIETPKVRYALGIGISLGGVFLFHLSYFLLVLSMTTTTIYMCVKRKNIYPFLHLAVVIGISQIITAWWWYPRNLYDWWVNHLVTSSQFYTTVQHLHYFGRTIGIIALMAIIYSYQEDEKWFWFLFLWALPLLLETQNETILIALHRIDLSWSTLGKPLEGFRFYVFLAQPISIFCGQFIASLLEKGETQESS